MKKYFLLPFAFCLLPSLALAQTPIVPLPSIEPLELNLLKPDAQLAGRNILTPDTLSPTGSTVPNLWWQKEQFAGKLLDNWLAYPNKKRVDLVVNRQLWALLDYTGRYSFVNSFGTVARGYGYNTRVFLLNQPQTPLATYTCNFNVANSTCSIRFESSRQDSLRRLPSP